MTKKKPEDKKEHELPHEHLSQFDKINKTLFDIDHSHNSSNPKQNTERMHKNEYVTLCRVHAVLAKLHKELKASQPVNVSKLLEDPELLKVAATYIKEDDGRKHGHRILKEYINGYLDHYNITRRAENRPTEKE